MAKVINLTPMIKDAFLQSMSVVMPETVKAICERCENGEFFTDENPCYGCDGKVTEAVFWDRIWQLFDPKDSESVEALRYDFEALRAHNEAKDLSREEWAKLFEDVAVDYCQMLQIHGVYEYCGSVDFMVCDGLFIDAVNSNAILSPLNCEELYHLIMNTVKGCRCDDEDGLQELSSKELKAVKGYLVQRLHEVEARAQSLKRVELEEEEAEHQSYTSYSVHKLHQELNNSNVFERGTYSVSEWAKLFDGIKEAGIMPLDTKLKKRAKAEALTYRFAHLMKPLQDKYSPKELRKFESLFMLAVGQAVSPEDRIWCNDVIEDALLKAKA